MNCNYKSYADALLLTFILLACISFNSYSQGIQVTFTTSYQNGGYNISCYGASDGYAAIASVTGGTAPYSYLWGTGATTDTISNLSDGIYTVYVTDASSNTVAAYCRLFQPNPLSVSFSSQLYNGYNISVNGNNDGNINTTVTGGTPSYSYLWNNTITDANPQNLNAGVYNLIITDVNGCTLTSSDTLTQPTPLSITSLTSPLANGYNISCNGSDNGSVNLSVSGGVQPYQYYWDNGANISNPAFFYAGSYTIQVTDANGAQVDSSITLTQPDALTLTCNYLQYGSYGISCYNCTDGTISADVTGGVTPYIYQWYNSNDSLIGTTDTLINLGPDSYYVIVTDNDSCQVQIDPITLTAPIQGTPLSLMLNIITPGGSGYVNCYGDQSAGIQGIPIGGTYPYSYSWNTSATTQNLLNIGIGDYILMVVDATGDTAIDSVFIYQPDSLTISSLYKLEYVPGINISVAGGNDGLVNISTIGGTAPYTFDLAKTGFDTSVTGYSAYIAGLTAGNYILTITDVNNCTLSDSFTLREPYPLEIDSLYSPVYNGYNIRCAGDPLGLGLIGQSNQDTLTTATINLAISGGAGGYSYSWSNGQGGTWNTKNVQYAIAGTYTVQITDANGAEVDSTITITQPSAITVNITPSYYPGGYNISCNNCSNGGITSQITGGISPYVYNWYKDTIIPDTLLLHWNGHPDTVIFPMSYDTLINTDTSIMHLNAENYYLYITDANGCFSSSEEILTLTQPAAGAAIQVFLNAHTYQGGYNVTCNGATNGRIHAFVTGGDEPYTYLWNTGDTTKNLSNVGAGAYVLTVSSDGGTNVAISDSIFLSQPDSLTASFTYQEEYNGYGVSVPGGNDGAIELLINGGTSNFHLTWSNGLSGPVIAQSDGGADQYLDGLSANINYTVAITDRNGCTLTDSITLTQPPALQIDSISSAVKNGGYNTSCYNGMDATAQVTVEGGVGGYSYTWSNGQGATWNMQTIASAPASHYTVQITDANGAEIDTGITLTQPPPLNIAFTVTHYPNGFNVSAVGATDDTLSANVAGGIIPYSYQWLNEATGGFIGTDSTTSNNGAGQYNITITDANGCTATNQRWIFQPSNYNGGWSMAGSANTNPAYNFIGTTDSTDFVMRTNNTEAMRITASGTVKVDSLANASNRILYADSNGRLSLGASAKLDTQHLNILNHLILAQLLDPCAFPTSWATGDNANNAVRCTGNVGIGNSDPAAKLDIISSGHDSTTMALSITDDESNPLIIVRDNGTVGIGLDPNTQMRSTTPYTLLVGGKLGAHEAWVSLGNTWPDYVFSKDYKLDSLESVKEYISKNNHLPDVPSAEEMKDNGGLNLGEMQTIMVKKVEELTLYMIQLQQHMTQLQQHIDGLEKENKELKSAINNK